MHDKTVQGFSKLSKTEKIKWVVKTFYKNPETVMREMKSYWHKDSEKQKIFDGFSENTISNFVLPYGVAPNFLINDKSYAVPMVIEESSVVAAASAAAKYWLTRGGFKTQVFSTIKVGQIHFKWNGDPNFLETQFPKVRVELLKETEKLTANMRQRGGGILDIELLNLNHLEDNLFQIKGSFETCDSMGANFINSTLEVMAQKLALLVKQSPDFDSQSREIEIIMAILSNYTPQCLVRALVECPIDMMGVFSNNMTSLEFAEKFRQALTIAYVDPYRAATHNKGIFNGIDAVVLATGNDFRAIEAGGHAYASKSGQYRSLSYCEIKGGNFKFWMDMPLAVGTVGGLTKLHPMAKRSLELLGNPSAAELMSIIASTGLAQNFAAIRSLITTGIQHGHMRMHLQNIVNHLQATKNESDKILTYFKDKTVSFSSVHKFLMELREKKPSTVRHTSIKKIT